MKSAVLITLAIVVVVSGAAHAQSGGYISLYRDGTGFALCDIASDVGLITVNVVHDFATGVTASQYMVDNYNTTMVYLADVNNFALVIGNSQTGIAVSYGACLGAPIHIQNVLYSGIGTSPFCSFLRVEPDPASPSGNIEAVDCAANKVFPQGGHFFVNADPGDCGLCGPDPVEEATWGKVKSLFR